MEFDKSRVYTALNADELKVGSKVFAADSLDALKQEVSNAPVGREKCIVEILPEETTHRFQVKGEDVYSLAYLISPPKEPEYQPFSDTETAFKIIAAHGGWIKNEEGASAHHRHRYRKRRISNTNRWCLGGSAIRVRNLRLCRRRYARRRTHRRQRGLNLLGEKFTREFCPVTPQPVLQSKSGADC